ncbi:MAG: hypothetical protein II868_01955, partial [Butyrivibrio sp.]|nr:hypothetical protein [Butyrivibrio sp.]
MQSAAVAFFFVDVNDLSDHVIPFADPVFQLIIYATSAGFLLSLMTTFTASTICSASSSCTM